MENPLDWPPPWMRSLLPGAAIISFSSSTSPSGGAGGRGGGPAGEVEEQQADRSKEDSAPNPSGPAARVPFVSTDLDWFEPETPSAWADVHRQGTKVFYRLSPEVYACLALLLWKAQCAAEAGRGPLEELKALKERWEPIKDFAKAHLDPAALQTAWEAAVAGNLRLPGAPPEAQTPWDRPQMAEGDSPAPFTLPITDFCLSCPGVLPPPQDPPRSGFERFCGDCRSKLFPGPDSLSADSAYSQALF